MFQMMFQLTPVTILNSKFTWSVVIPVFRTRSPNIECKIRNFTFKKKTEKDTSSLVTGRTLFKSKKNNVAGLTQPFVCNGEGRGGDKAGGGGDSISPEISHSRQFSYTAVQNTCP